MQGLGDGVALTRCNRRWQAATTQRDMNAAASADESDARARMCNDSRAWLNRARARGSFAARVKRILRRRGGASLASERGGLRQWFETGIIFDVAVGMTSTAVRDPTC